MILKPHESVCVNVTGIFMCQRNGCVSVGVRWWVLYGRKRLCRGGWTESTEESYIDRLQ